MTMLYQQQRFCRLPIGNEDSELQDFWRNLLDLLYGAQVFVEGVKTHKQQLRSVHTVAQVMIRTEDVPDTKQEAPEAIWTLWGREESLASAGNQINLWWTKRH
jgi:hypothetical protein